MDNLGQRWRLIRFNPLRSLTPERLASALDSAAAGWLREASLIYETIEQREAIVRSVMTKRRAAVARRDWTVITSDPDHPAAAAHKATLEYFYHTHRSVNKTTGGAEALTLADGAFLGQRLNVNLVVDGGDGTLTPTTASGWTSVVLAEKGQGVELEWTTAGWRFLGFSYVTNKPLVAVP